MPCPAGAITIVPKTPNSPGPYAKAHPDRVRKFLIAKRTFIDPEVVDDKSRNGWRHKLEHDAELLRYCRNVRPTWVKFDSKDTKESGGSRF